MKGRFCSPASNVEPAGIKGRRPATAPSARRDPVLLAAFAFAVVSRLAFLWAIYADDFPYGRYLAPAREFLRGYWFSPGSAEQLPGAPLFFAFVMLFSGESFSALAVAQHALGLATWGLIVALAWRAGGLAAARWTAVLLSLQLILPYQERFALSEATAHFLLAAALYAAAGAEGQPTRGRAALAGLLAGLAALSRGEFLVLGPLLAAALSLPRGRSWGRTGAFAAAWALALGGWLAHNRLAGVGGFNALGSSILVDTAMPLIRHDLPSQALAKSILREEEAACGGQPRCTPRLRAVRRLQFLSGEDTAESLIRAQAAVGEVAREAILTRPFAYLPRVWANVRKGLRPIAWVSEDQLVRGSAVGLSRERGGGREALWDFLERGPQYAGWAPLLLALLAPLGLRGAPAGAVRAAALAAAVSVGVLLALAPADMSARLQSSIYLPLCVLGGLCAAFLPGRLGFFRARG